MSLSSPGIESAGTASFASPNPDTFVCGTLATSDCAGHCAHLLQIRSFPGEKQRSIHGLRKRVCGRHSSNRYIRIRASAECVGTPIVTGRSNQKFIDDFTRRPENTGKGRESSVNLSLASLRK